MIDLIEDVYTFHQKFELMPHDKTMLDHKTFAYRRLFMDEELGEWEKSREDDNLEGCLDAMIDLVYVAIGTLVFHGFSEEEAREAWCRVHEANLKKVRAISVEASKRHSMLDVVKPDGWVKPDLSDLCR